jgi:4-amino-4-deoxy-L-arabinose transferase-like glycosyltransferase
LLLRVVHLRSIPVAGDESVYIRWAEIIVDQNQWFISLLDGKQPLSYWLYAFARLLWPGDPLWSARFVSAVAGVLSTLGIFAIGRRLSGETAGLIAAALYAFFPYALLYDRLAYTESLVNLAGIAIVYASIVHFGGRPLSWKRSLGPALALGLGFFTKSTALLFAFFPLAAAAWLARDRGRRLLAPLAVIYGVAAIFPLLAWLAVPRAPMMQTHSLVLHQTSFFVAPAELLRNPFLAAPGNIRLLGAYIAAYVTVPVAVAALAAIVYLGWRRSVAALAVFSASVLPLIVQVFVLQKMFPSRYPFPHFWPWFVILGMAAAGMPLPANRSRRILSAVLLAALVAGPMLRKALGVIRSPAESLYIEDSRTFLGSGPAAGFGIREAADYLLAEAGKAPLVILTDPIWGPPADAIFAFLNERQGIRVYEAWWTSISPRYPIIPPAPVEVLKSQYERVAAGVLNPAVLGRVYYVTERYYMPPAAVRLRQPGAELVASFPKPGGRDSIDVYRLR